MLLVDLFGLFYYEECLVDRVEDVLYLGVRVVQFAFLYCELMVVLLDDRCVGFEQCLFDLCV